MRLALPIAIALAVVLATPHVVRADAAADVGKLVETAVAHIDDDQVAAAMGLGARIIGTDGVDNGDYTMGKAPLFQAFGDAFLKADRKLGKVTVIVDGQRAWFQAPCAVELSSPGKSEKLSVHVAGMAWKADGSGMDHKVGWAISVLMFDDALSDAELMKMGNAKLSPAKPAPGSELGKEVVSWFDGGTLGKHAAAGDVIAGGTAPTELATNADAIAMAKTWDPLKMVVTKIDEETDELGWVFADVLLPAGKGKGYVPLAVAVYAVKDGGVWKWKSLQWGTRR
ncbi:MAG TPA: hypothetical protein VGH63_16645 [Polyangia bacterium]|jgi:hypothetical protein